MKTKLILSFLFIILSITSCDTTDPPDNKSLTLKLEDVSCTEAWIELTTTNLQLPATITLKQTNPTGDTKSHILNLNTKDSLLYVDSLLPNKSYSFIASQSSAIGGLSGISSNELSVTTMDTTSQAFSWQTFEFGVNTYQSQLFDVAIIDENNIWAVGEIYMLDSLGQPDSKAYNAVHWNGTSWELKRIYYYGACSAVEYPPLRAIWTFSENNIVITNGGSIGWFDGNTVNLDCGVKPLLTGAINKIWGSRINDLYVIGSNGNVARFNGSQWIRIESGTDLSLVDITANNLDQIFVCGGNPSFAQGIILKSTDGSNFSTFVEGANIPESELFNPYLYGSFSSIWFDQNNTLYSGGNILFQYKLNKWDYVKSLPENFIGGNPGNYYRGYITRVRGNASNDMWIVGDRNTLRHFNGLTWEQIGMPYNPQIDLVWRGIACDNTTIIVGSHERSAIIIMIKK